jgi:hypothetical protein
MSWNVCRHQHFYQFNDKYMTYFSLQRNLVYWGTNDVKSATPILSGVCRHWYESFCIYFTGWENMLPNRDSKPGPSEYCTVALPTELSGHLHIFSPKQWIKLWSVVTAPSWMPNVTEWENVQPDWDSNLGP